MNQQARKRIKTIERIRNTLKEASERKEGIEYKKLVAVVCLKSGVAERTGKEYVNLFVNSGEFVLEK